MSARKKLGLGMVITGALFLVVGLVTIFTTAAPTWVPMVLALVAAVAGVFGLAITLPTVP